MPRKLTQDERATLVMGRASQIAISDEWFDGDVWALEGEDFAPLMPEIARQQVRNYAARHGWKVATKIREGVLYVQKINGDTLVVETDSDGETPPVEGETPAVEPETEGRRGR